MLDVGRCVNRRCIGSVEAVASLSSNVFCILFIGANYHFSNGEQRPRQVPSGMSRGPSDWNVSRPILCPYRAADSKKSAVQIRESIATERWVNSGTLLRTYTTNPYRLYRL